MPEDVAFISSKSGVETSLDGKVMSVTKKVRTDRQTDGFSSFRLRKELHSVVQSAVDGERKRLETFRNKLVDARRRGFHFEQVRSRNVARRQSYERNEKSADGQTDRRLFVFI